MTPPQKLKSPWLAAILNLISPGLVYLYAGSKREFFKVGLPVTSVALTFVYFVPIDDSWTITDTAEIVIGIIVAILFAVDAYKDAQEVNVAV